jgi:DNA-binding CsgD family transcriptional regulator
MNKRLYLSNSLTPKELEVLYAIVEKGIFDTNSLAKKLCITSSTVRTHLQSIYAKFQVISKAELVYRYYQFKEEKGVLN